MILFVLTCVYVCVFLHVRFLMKSLTTEIARIRPGVTVNEEMCGKCAASLECFATLWTLKSKL